MSISIASQRLGKPFNLFDLIATRVVCITARKINGLTKCPLAGTPRATLRGYICQDERVQEDSSARRQYSKEQEDKVFSLSGARWCNKELKVRKVKVQINRSFNLEPTNYLSKLPGNLWQYIYSPCVTLDCIMRKVQRLFLFKTVI
jgi:hypothetical protein